MIDDTTPAKSESAKTESTNPASDSTAKSDGAPANYSRGEGQKGVTQAYRDNWHVIFGDAKKPARAKRTQKKSARASGAKAKPATSQRTTSASRKRKSGRR
jgi:hypothetical protein